MPPKSNRGSGSKFDLKNKDRSTSTPVHETKEFRDQVRRIRQEEKDDGRPVTPSIAAQSQPKEEDKKTPTFNIPMPAGARKPKGGQHSSSFNQEKYETALQKSVRQQVIKNTPAPSSPVYQKKYNERIENETKRLVDIIKRPRYVMLSDGTPFYLSKEDERSDLERSLLGESTWKKNWTLAKYDIASGINGLTQWIGMGATRTKELFTDTGEEGNVIGGIAQLGLNSAILSWEYLRAAPRELFVSEERYKNLERQAEAIKYTDPVAATNLKASAEHWKKQYQLKLAGQERMSIAERAVDRAWQSLFGEFEEGQDRFKELREKNPNANQYQLQALALEEIKKEQKAAEQNAASVRTQVLDAAAKGDFEKAIELTKQAQEFDRDARFADPYGAYSWAREPERYEAFKEDAARLELQKGEPLTDEELRRLKEYHVNSWTEITGEMVFDPVNLVPATLMAKAYSMPLRGTTKIAKVVGKEVPILGKAATKTIDVMGKPVRWLLRESVQSGGNRVARQTYNIFQRINNAYTTTDEMTKAMDGISNYVMDAKRAANEDGARAVFETARKEVPGLQQITFNDFKHLMDSADHVDPTEWGKRYSDAVTKADLNLTEVAARSNKSLEEVVSDFSKNRFALGELADNFKAAFVDPHRIFKGARLTDDTLAGWITKKMRSMSGDDLNEMMKLTKNDVWLAEKSVKMGDKLKSTIQASTHLVEGSLAFAAHARDMWASFVLTTFRWPINNLIDTSMRSVVWGGNIWDDLTTLFTSTQRTLADELGIAPLEFNNALAREGLGFTEQVPHKLLYENYKPKFGVFSFIGEEYKRLLSQHGDDAVAKNATMKQVIGKLPDGALKKNLASVYDGMNYRVNLWTALSALPGGIQDFNTAIEFTFRLRMFHKEYFDLLKKLEPQFMERGLDTLNPATREIAKQIWSAAEGNPRKITAYVENLLGTNKNLPASWSVTVPQEVEDILGKMDIGNKHLFMSSVKNELDLFIETATRNGQDLKEDDFKKFFDGYKTKLQDEVQHRLSKTHDYRDVDTGINTDKKANKVATEDDIKGSMPTPKAESPRNAEVEAAMGRLNRKKKRKPLDIHKDFETAIQDYAKVERVSGDGVRVVKKGNDLVVEVGDNVLKKGSSTYYNKINDAVISIFKNQDTDLITHSGFTSTDHYETVMREFFDDPTAVLNKDERQFLALVNQMENHPHLRQIVSQTSPETVRKYDSALDMYREIGEYSDVYGFNKRPDQIMMSEAEKIRPIPGSYSAAANETRIATRKLVDAGKAVSPEIETAVREFVGQLQVYRQELKQFYAFTYPGPLMRATTEGGRHAGWDMFYRLGEAEFQNETAITRRVIDLLQKDPEAAKKLMSEANDNFAEFFLKENGIELEWDVDRQMIMNIKVKGLDGKNRNFTARRDIANMQIRFFSPQTKKTLENAPIRVMNDPKLKLHTQLRNALRDTFQLDTAHAEAWAKVMDNHAQKWAQETGQPIEKYYERLGFQHVESASAKGLGTLDQTRIVKRGAVKRTDEGHFMFYGLSHSNFESMVRETGELFFDDLISMAEHSTKAADDLKALKTFLESKTGKPIRANKLEQVHSDILSDTFSSYIATGHGPDIKIKNGFDRLKKWMTQTFDAVRDSKVAGEIPDDTYRVLDRMFTEAQLFDVPQSNARAIRLMAKEADLAVQEEDDLLKIINDALGQPTLTPDEIVEVKKLEDEVAALNDEYQAILGERADLAGDNAMANATLGNDPRLMEIEARLESAKNKVDAYYLERTPAGRTYQNLGEVPKDVAARILGTPDAPLDAKISQELQDAWMTWRTQRGLTGFPDEALTDADTFKAYLKRRMGEEWSEVGNHYNRLLWEVEQFEDAILNYHSGDDLRSVVFPRVHEAQMSNGMKTFVRNQEDIIKSYEIANRALDSWSSYAGKMMTDGHPAQLLTKDEQAALKAWAYGDGSKAKAELVDTLLNGNAEKGIDGAIPLVNKRMLDYQHTNVFDQWMKNWFPFWMFPSRSFPFWAETIATHPQLIANYEKVQRLSRSQRYQAGAVTSQGKPLPSLDGYIQVPGTDTWFNPLAPFSFRYLLDVQKSRDDILYAAQSDSDIDPQAFLASELMQTGQIYGFSLAPWAAWSVKKALGVPDEIIPRYPLIPEIQLIPRWWTQELIQRTNKMLNVNLNGIHDTVYPEVPWHDYMVERRILENALQQIQSGNLSEADKLKLMNKAQNAIKYKGDNELWQQSYKDLTNDSAMRSVASFFSGLYAKNFGDGEADLLALRNELNLLKSSLNNEFQANIFDLPVDAETGWKHYLDKMDTPEGWVHRLYSDIGWVKNEEGELTRDPKERARWLATKIDQDEDQQMYYDKMANLQTELNKRLRALPIGADWEQSKLVFDWYAEEAESLDYLRTFEKVYGSNKPVELIQKDIANDWFRKLKATQPRWDFEGGETYDEYQQRVAEWETNIPNIAPLYMRAYMRRRDLVSTLGALKENQQFNTGQFFNELVGMSNIEGLEMYEKENDDVFDALNRAWKETYWGEYWGGVIGKSGYAVDLAENDFYNKHQQPPSTDELYSWIVNYYGPEKFTRDEIAKYVEGTDSLSIEERRLQGEEDPADYKARQDIWNMLSWMGPGSKNRGVFDQAFVNAGGDPDWLTTWYQESGEAYKTKPERLEQLRASIQQAVSDLGLQPPERAELVRYVKAQKENDTFKQLVTAELGNQFYDYEDEDGVMQQGVYSYYNSLPDYKAKKQFKSDHPEEYDAIQSFYDIKELFQEEHPVWADYYGFDTEPSVSLPVDETTGSTMTPPALSTPTRGKPRKEEDDNESGGGGKSFAPRPTVSRFGDRDDTPKFNIYDRTSTYVSPGLYNLIGEKMAGEIAGLFSSGRKISAAGVSFLMSVRSRYPDYRDDVDRILAKNG